MHDGWADCWIQHNGTLIYTIKILSPCSIQLWTHLNEFHRISQSFTSFFSVRSRATTTKNVHGFVAFHLSRCMGFLFISLAGHTLVFKVIRVYSLLSAVGYRVADTSFRLLMPPLPLLLLLLLLLFHFESILFVGLKLSLSLFHSFPLHRIARSHPNEEMFRKICNKNAKKKSSSNTFFGRRTRCRVRGREQTWTLLV